MSKKMESLKGRVVVITGAGSGIGRALSLAFGEAGAHIACADLNIESAEATAREVQTFGVKAIGVRCDVTRPEQVVELANITERDLGPVSVLINNAGVGLGGPVERISLEDWSWQLGPNLWGVIHGVHTFLPAMLARGEGHIVNVASVAGLIGVPQMVPYVTTKFAVVGLSESLRFELAHRGVGVTVVCPGFVKTNIFKASRVRGDKELPLDVLERTAMQPEVLAREVVAAVRSNRARVVVPMQARVLSWVRTRMPGLWDSFGQRLGQFLQRQSLRG